MDDHIKTPELHVAPKTGDDVKFEFNRLLVNGKWYSHIGSQPAYAESIVWLKWPHDQKKDFIPLPGKDGWTYVLVEGKDMYNKDVDSAVLRSGNEVHLFQPHAKAA